MERSMKKKKDQRQSFKARLRCKDGSVEIEDISVKWRLKDRDGFQWEGKSLINWDDNDDDDDLVSF